ncbi:unnamed protein product [Symbiodinium natans]|uniref:Uncharacterized protein n=1 Tax=Symbiodinium natans TaxID=878477 RepID=A0A812UX77_9DINO|nr:unnamed protein product [Symbiodinium natans]
MAWRRVVDQWPSAHSELRGDVLNVAEREVRPGLSLGESDGFATVVMLLDHLLDRELMETSESQHRNLQVSFHKLPFRNVLPLDHHTQAHLAALISGYLGNDYVAGNLNMRGRTEVSVDLAGLHRTLHVPSDGTPGRVRELVAARANRHTSEIAAVAPDVLSELRPAMADRIFVELRWTNTDYVRRMEGWRNHGLKKDLVKFVQDLEDRPMPCAPDGTWASTDAFDLVVTQLTDMLATTVRTRGPEKDDLGDLYTDLLDFLQNYVETAADPTPDGLRAKLLSEYE